MVDQLQDGNSVVISGFGSFEVKKKMERISVNPVSHQRLLIPPKLVVGFKPSSSVKEEVK
jgi:DNA-binding protein HU-beta